ncbi:MAG: CRISPR-associated protein Cas4 [Spirochaetota bacterium]|nr:CRISPR-associated protein Cas4 [Spirochaetota bacterium]
MIDDDKIWIRPTDIKNWNYCERIPFYHYYGGKGIYKTASMEYGKHLHELQTALEDRNKGRKYGILNLRKSQAVILMDSASSLSGRLDMLLYDENESVYPVEFKNIPGRPSINHIGQLVSYAFLLKANQYNLGDHGFIFNIGKKHLYKIDLEPEQIESIRGIVDKIREYIYYERLPEPTKHKGKCRNCEFLRFCNDIF